MTPEQKAAYIMAQAACLHAKIAGMVAENIRNMAANGTVTYLEDAFDIAINESGCHHNAVIEFFRD